MASSSQTVCASPHADPCWKYDVFLSFRGVDTRMGITVELYDRLKMSGIKTFMDKEDLRVGDVISPSLSAAIKESRFAIVVLSKNYASSRWCLEELREICSSMGDKNRILPLFYEVDPTDVRYQKRSFGEALSKHESSGRHESEKVEEWKSALAKVAQISGWNKNDYKSDKELVNAIVEYLRSKVVLDAVESIGDFQAFEATSKAIDEVIEALKDDKVTIVGVYGMAGVGKTTMVKHVGAVVKRAAIFDHVIVAVLSQSPDSKRTQHTLAEQLGFDLHGNTELLATRLHKEIMRREKLLIILDDVWARTELSAIGIPMYTELQKCKSKVLLTTRRLNVCHAMECQKNITLNLLSEKDAWTLFVTKARRSFTSTTFKDVAEKVARECRGLPVALIPVARALGDKELVEWKTAAQALEKSQSANGDHDKVAFECIKLSYDYLKDEDYKLYFLLCCLYPEDHDIPIKDLFKYGIGKGLFREADTLKEARDRADSVVTHLKHSCLLLDSGEDGCVRMHDVVRDTAINIAKYESRFLVKAGCGLKAWPRQFQEDYIAVSLRENNIDKLPEKLVCPKLQILLLNHNEFTVLPEIFFQSLNDLRVLDLSYTCISLRPQSISLPTNLIALILDRCPNTIDISMIGELKKLEILSVRFSYLKEFSKAISGLISLKILDMTGASIDILISKIIPNLPSLEELYMYGLREEHTRTGSRNKRTKVEREAQETNSFNLVTRLSKLRVLEVQIADAKCIPAYVECSPDWDEFDIDIGTNGEHMVHGYRNMHQYGHKSISFSLDTISGLPNWFFNSVMNKTERLWWYNCQQLIKLFVESTSGRLQALKYLTVQGIPAYERMKTITWVPKTPVFVNLEELRLNAVNCMGLFVGDLPQGSLRNLKLLDLASCYYWGDAVLLPSRLLQRLPNLEELTCRDIEWIENLFGCEVLFEPEQPKLRKIVLHQASGVRSICHGPVPPAMFQTLQSLSILKCKGLEGSLFTYDVAQCLSQLNFLELRECYLTRIVEASNKKTILPKLKELVLSRLPMLHYSHLTFDIECPSLEYLELEDCPRFIVSLSDFRSRKQIQYKRNKGMIAISKRTHSRNTKRSSFSSL